MCETFTLSKTRRVIAIIASSFEEKLASGTS
jgi:hypothetical protein